MNKVKQMPAKWQEAQVEMEEPEIMTAEVDPSSMSEISERENSELPVDMSEWTVEELEAYNNLRSKRKKCCIGGCTHRSLPIARSYHQLPVRNKEVWAKWIEVIRWSRNEPDWVPNGDAAPLVCSRHFPDSDFISYEASSRVRLSHTAIPIYYIDPAAGTVMDQRFDTPLPIPAIIPGNVKKDARKGKSVKMDQDEDAESPDYNLSHLNYEEANDLSQLSSNYGYGTQEADNDRYSGMKLEIEPALENYLAENFSDQAINYSISNSPSIRQSRLSLPSSLISIQKPKQAFSHVKNKPPALIKANFASLQMQSSSSSAQSKLIALNALGGKKPVLRKDPHQLTNNSSSSSRPTKHKIGIAKCRLIVDTLENQLRIAKIRLAEQLGIPYLVVQSVWNMKDTLKDRLSTSS